MNLSAVIAFGLAAGASSVAAAATPQLPPTRISITSTAVPVRRGVATVRLSCQKGEVIRLTCRGTLVLRTLRSSGSRRVVAARRVGRVRFAIPNCCSARSHAVHVPLGRAGRALVARRRRVTVEAVAVLDGREARGARSVLLRSRR